MSDRDVTDATDLLVVAAFRPELAPLSPSLMIEGRTVRAAGD
ncbi:MAG: hypothetical protein WCJ30_07765 [Deltaproteobacteria bacterium]